MQPPPPSSGGAAGPPAAAPSNGFGLASMILGIVSIPLCICWGVGVIPGVAAVILGVLGKQKADRGEATNRGMAMTGIITGSIGAILAIVAWILLAVGSSVDWNQWTDN